MRGVSLSSEVLGSVLAVAAALAGIGLFTSYAGAVVSLSAAYLALYLAPPRGSLEAIIAMSMVVVVGVALALTGPGAFSLDSRLFGRREIIIPRGAKPENS